MKIAYHTPTKELFIKQVKKWLDGGKCWIVGGREINEQFWDTYKEETCVECEENEILYASKQFFLNYNYKIMPVEKTLETLEVGDLIQDKNKNYSRVLIASGVGELRTYGLSFGNKEKNSDNLKRYRVTCTAFEFKEFGYTVVSETERTVDDVLSELSEEDKEILKKAMK